LKYKIEKVLFSNKSIFFYDKGTKYSFLVIINDEYIKKERNHYGYDYDLRILTKEKLNFRIFTNIIDRTTNKDSINVLNISIASLELINLSEKKIEVILLKKTFNGLTNLKSIDLSQNLIKEIHPDLFNGLENLNIINFSGNKIKIILENTFVRLNNLNEANFSRNRIKEIHPNIFSGLSNLEIIDFSYNQIEVIHDLNEQMYFLVLILFCSH
jgi:Leucine-rich repeat (LRR) protein